MVALPNPRLTVIKDKKSGLVPSDWCLGNWHNTFEAWEEKWGKTPVRSACAHDDDCAETPENLRAEAEAKLVEMGVWPQGLPLLLDVYTAGRNVRSEFGDGTPEEKAAVILAGLNRAREENQTLTEHLIHRDRKNYGRQIGVIRPASTAQDPMVSDILIANYILIGMENGVFSDITSGATHYLDRVSQDFMRQRSVAANAENAEISILPSGEEVYLDWTSGGDYLTWVGHIPNVRPTRLFLFRRMREFRPADEDTPAVKQEKMKLRQTIREAGLQAIKGTNRAPSPWSGCETPEQAVSRMTGAALIGVLGATSTIIGISVGVIATRSGR